jgi:uncharacterized protein (DUF2267 family)
VDPLGEIARVARIDRAAAERAARAVLQTLAERLSKGKARDLASRLPAPLAAWLHTTTDAEPFGYDEFLRRVAEREGVDIETAARHARAVFWALGGQVGADEAEALAAELPQDFAPLTAEAQRRFFDTVELETFLAKVAEQMRISEAAARRVAEAVLETLAERISGGEVDDLAARLPLELRPALERGRERSGGRPAKLSLDRFLKRVGERLGIDPLLARPCVEAVFVALRETLPRDELLDVIAELPNEYASVGAPVAQPGSTSP